MYLRHATVRENGKSHTYWREGKVRQQTVAHLGELDVEGRAKAEALAQMFTGAGKQLELFEAPS